ncbi:MAG: isocitrate lyase/phosphoenolpyruvate mutase family protein [Bacteroidota bacterium]
MPNKLNQKEKALQLHQLHQTNQLLVLPNIWDVLGAKLLESIGYQAIATASAAIAFTNGYHDGEKIPFADLLFILKRIAGRVNVPVTADIESGYARNELQLEKNMALLIETGIAGINLEDTNHTTNQLYTISEQCSRISAIRKVSERIGIPLFINARTDVFLHENTFPTPISKFEELINRGQAYKAAGADCFYPIALKEKDTIQTLVTQLDIPINILALPGIPDLKTLHKMGVVRVSLGPSYLKIAIKAMKTLALDLKNDTGLLTVTQNEITSDYLKTLIE